MAECAIIPSNFKLHWQGRFLKDLRYKSLNSSIKFNSRNCKNKPLHYITKWDAAPVNSCSVASSHRRRGLRCTCLGTLIDAEIVAASDWIPVIDQVLLTASIFLTYMAGVFPTGTPYSDSQRKNSSESLLNENPSIAGSSTAKRDDKTVDWCAWDVVREKLVDSIHAIEHGGVIDHDDIEFKQYNVNRPLGLYAIADGPRFRLILSCLQQLQKEVTELPGTLDALDRDVKWEIFSRVIQKAYRSACSFWMEEFCMDNGRNDKEIMLSMSEKLKVKDTVLHTIDKSGKVDLFADLLFYLKYGYAIDCYHYSPDLYAQHRVSILEDLVIDLADGIASTFLELISVDGDFADKTNNLGFSLCTLSTRALQKLRNEVAMSQWIYQNVEAVVSMYEDRFDLCVLQRQQIQKPINGRNVKLNWWKKLGVKRSATVSSLVDFFLVAHFSLTVKRTKELRALTGWKYYLSLLLEVYDIALPMVRAVVGQVRNGISFFLVSLIGRSLGLIYTGIRQSLRWK